MGRGRQKAKHTKVARELKYNTPNTDLDALARELAGKPAPDPGTDEDSYSLDPYADEYSDKYR